MKFIVFFIAFFAIGVPAVMMAQSFTKGSDSVDLSYRKQGSGCLSNLVGVFLVLFLFFIAAAVSSFF